MLLQTHACHATSWILHPTPTGACRGWHRLTVALLCIPQRLLHALWRRLLQREALSLGRGTLAGSRVAQLLRRRAATTATPLEDQLGPARLTFWRGLLCGKALGLDLVDVVPVGKLAVASHPRRRLDGSPCPRQNWSDGGCSCCSLLGRTLRLQFLRFAFGVPLGSPRCLLPLAFRFSRTLLLLKLALRFSLGFLLCPPCSGPLCSTACLLLLSCQRCRFLCCEFLRNPLLFRFPCCLLCPFAFSDLRRGKAHSVRLDLVLVDPLVPLSPVWGLWV